MTSTFVTSHKRSPATFHPTSQPLTCVITSISSPSPYHKVDFPFYITLISTSHAFQCLRNGDVIFVNKGSYYTEIKLIFQVIRAVIMNSACVLRAWLSTGLWRLRQYVPSKLRSELVSAYMMVYFQINRKLQKIKVS